MTATIPRVDAPAERRVPAGPAAPPMIGRRLGDFVVRELLARGGGGEVYLAVQAGLDRQAVIKTLHPGPPRAGAGDRFLHEARLASRIDHPYAAHIYAFGAEPDGVRWLAMELVRGTTLTEWLRASGPLSPARLAGLFERLCDVVQAAHQQGIVHRDLKPDNVMVVSRGGRLLPKLLDLGIATAFEDGAAAGTGLLGTPHYMAPEQWVDPASAGVRADLYALGVVAYQCLTGRVPFDGRSPREVGRAHLSRPVPPAGEQVPAPVAAVLERALAKRPDDRFPSALALAAALRDAAGADAGAPAFPELDPDIRDATIARAPQPLADAVALLGAARNPHQARDAVVRVVQVSLRYLTALAMAARTRGPVDDGDDLAEARELVRGLVARSPSAGDWLRLARALVRPDRDRSDAHPVPELVGLFFPPAGEPAGSELWDALARRIDDGQRPAADAAHDFLAGALPELARALAALAFLADYRVVVPDGARGEEWMGAQRRSRRWIRLQGAAEAGRPLMVDAAGAPLLELWPLLQVGAPSPGMAEELFLFDGPGHGGARLVAQPHGYQRTDPAVWDWLRARLLDEGPGDPALAGEPSPFPGLTAFRREDAAWFFGRERAAEAFCNRLRTRPLLAVVGASGAGKSSFVQAGVLPRLPGGWSAITVRPGPAPLAALTARLWAEGIGSAGQRGAVATDPDALGELLRGHAAARGPIMLIVDQFEELITLCAEPGVREQVARSLARAARAADEPVRVVIALRDDFLAAASELPELGPLLAPGLEVLATPGNDELRRILVEPVERAGYRFEDAAMPEEMIRDLPAGAGALPLLSFTAARLWAHRDRHFRQLRRNAYQALGGVAGALARHADSTVAEMPAAERRLVREAFCHLITAEGTRAVLTRRELAELLGDGPRAAAVIARLIDARLLVAGEDPGGDERIEIVHEALIAAWPQLVEWRRELAEGARLRDQVRDAARQWEQRGRPAGLLWRGEALLECQLWRGRTPLRLAAVERAFIAASEAEASRGRRIRRTVVVAGFALLSAALAVVLWSQARTAEQRSRAQSSAAESESRLRDLRIEQGRQAYLRGEPLQAMVYLEAAYQRGARNTMLAHLLGGSSRALDAELLTLAPRAGWIRRARYAAGGDRIVTSGLRGRAAVWDAASGRPLHRLADQVFTIAVDDAGGRAATGGIDGQVAIWDLRSGRRLLALRADRGWVRCVDFSPAGDRLLAAGDDGVARVWALPAGTPLLQLDHGERAVHHCEFAPRGDRIMTGSATTRLWRADTGAPLHTWGPPGQTAVAGFAPDGGRVVTANLSHPEVQVWDGAGGRLLATLRGHSRGVVQAQFSPDGRRIVTASADRSAKIWDADTGKLVVSLDGHRSQVLVATFDRSGTRVATAASDEVALWDASSGRKLGALVGHLDSVPSVEFHPGGTRLLTGSFDGTARVWSAAPSGVIGALGGGGAVVAAAFAPDGRTILTQSVDQAATLWSPAGDPLATYAGRRAPVEVHDWQILESYRVSPAIDAAGVRAAIPGGDAVDVVNLSDGRVLATLAGHPAKVNVVRFFPGGDRLITAAGTAATVWTATGVRRQTLAHQDVVEAIEAAPDGDAVATGSLDGIVRIWDPDTGALRWQLDGHRFGVVALAWAPEGRRLVSASPDGNALVWDVITGQRLVTAAAGQPLCGAAVSPEGDRIAAIGCGGAVHIWDAATGLPLETRPTSGQRGFSIAFSPDGDRLLVGNGAAELLDVRLDSRSPEQWRALLRERVPYQLEGERLVAAPE